MPPLAKEMEVNHVLLAAADFRFLFTPKVRDVFWGGGGGHLDKGTTVSGHPKHQHQTHMAHPTDNNNECKGTSSKTERRQVALVLSPVHRHTSFLIELALKFRQTSRFRMMHLLWKCKRPTADDMDHMCGSTSALRPLGLRHWHWHWHWHCQYYQQWQDQATVCASAAFTATALDIKALALGFGFIL